MLKRKIYSKTHIPTNTGTQTNTHICIFHTYIKILSWRINLSKNVWDQMQLELS